VPWPSAPRQAAFEAWFGTLPPALELRRETLRPASADASFRRYLRVEGRAASYVVMDAPPPQEDVRPFVKVAGLLLRAGLHVPQVLAADVEHGFLLLDDLGRRLYLEALREASAEQTDLWMREAIGALVRMQAGTPADQLPAFDEALLRRELELFPEWCVQREFGIAWDEAQRSRWDGLCRVLIDSALAQPALFVHRDWMPRNLMVCDPNPGILDFQDAVRGPITYDIACLLRDAFISWDEEREVDWAVRWWQAARHAGLPVAGDFGECWRQIEWMGMQRHLKVAGIFCRLKHRDGKPAYAADLPRFFDYLTKVALRYRPLQGLLPLIEPLSGRAVSSGFTF
jgi:aminoglycoside/choline kinase family phosphotransferase